jgi:hypothetical protein
MFQSLWVVGFVLVLVGSFLLIKQKRYGGIMLIVSTILWAIGYGIDVITIFPYVNIPIGALLCGIVGVVSLVYKK